MKQNLLAALVLSLALTASAEAFHNPVTLADQGSFTAGGTVVTAAGERSITVSLLILPVRPFTVITPMCSIKSLRRPKRM